MGELTRKSAIVGAYEFPLRRAPGYTPLRMEAECAKAALEQAGLTLRDVDGVWGVTAPVRSTGSAFTMCDYWDIHPHWTGDTNIGGASFLHHLIEATALIAAGHVHVGLITYSQVPYNMSVRAQEGGARRGVPRAPQRVGEWYTEAFHQPFGVGAAAQNYSLVAHRHMHEFGTTSEQLAEIAVATRYHASLNPDAKYRDPITVEDVVNSRLIAKPLHLLDCCMVSDGGGAIVVASADRARDLKQKPIWFLGGASAIEHRSAGYRDFSGQAAAYSGPRAFADAGVTHKDIDTVQIYDSFTITVLTSLEGLGFAKKGEGGQFVQGGRLRLDGELPLNTDGGGLSSNHPGARGIFLLIEAARQLWGGLGERQVKDAEIALCHGTGGSLGINHSGVTVILTNR